MFDVSLLVKQTIKGDKGGTAFLCCPISDLRRPKQYMVSLEDGGAKEENKKNVLTIDTQRVWHGIA